MKLEKQCSTDKNTIRKQMISKRKMLSNTDVNLFSEEIFNKFLSLNITPKLMFCYIDFINEVKTDKFLSFFKEKSKICVPVCEGDIMNCAIYNETLNFIVTKLGVKEPENPIFIKENEIDLCIIPGVAFDENGNRIGYGKGFYDKFLSNNNVIKIGVCYDFQVLKNIISSSHDIKMDYIITEKRIIKI